MSLHPCPSERSAHTFAIPSAAHIPLSFRAQPPVLAFARKHGGVVEESIGKSHCESAEGGRGNLNFSIQNLFDILYSLPCTLMNLWLTHPDSDTKITHFCIESCRVGLAPPLESINQYESKE